MDIWLTIYCTLQFLIKLYHYYHRYIPDCKPPLGEADAKNHEGPSRVDSLMRKQKTLERNKNKIKQQKQNV